MYIYEIKYVHNWEGYKMPPFEKMYYQLFNAITDALRKMEAHDYEHVTQILIAAQQWGENAYMEKPGKE